MDFIASLIIRFLNIVFNLLPMNFNLWVGRCMGNGIYLLSGKRNKVAYSNIKAAFYREKTPREIKKITKKAYASMGQIFMEILCITKIDRKYIDKYIEIENLDRAIEAAQNPKGMIFLSAHFGNWELATITSVFKVCPLYVLARDQKMRKLNELLNIAREMKGNVVIRKSADIKNIFRVLRQGKAVGILGDQNAGSNGEMLDFFGRPASTAIGPYRFSQASGAYILPVFIHRKKGPYHKVVVHKPMKIEKKGSLIPYMQEYNKLLEENIKLNPEQWMWMHKKWKMCENKKVLILDDGKKGHLNQSLAILKQINKYREKGGHTEEKTKVQRIKIDFKNKYSKPVLNLLMPLMTTCFGLHQKILKLVLSPESYNTLIREYFDVIISCGSSLHGVNLALSLENNARNITVFDPGPLTRRRFGLVLLPKHDFKRLIFPFSKEKTIVTDLSPNLIDPESISPFLGYDKDQNKKYVGILFGGDNDNYYFDDIFTKNIFSELESISSEMNLSYYITTSRRTPDSCYNIIVDVFKDKDICVDIVYGKKDTDENTVQKILAHSDIIIVSGESISMVSEAVSSGKKVIVFMPLKKKKRIDKYEKFINYLGKEGYITIASSSDLSIVIKKHIEKDTDFKGLFDDERIYEKMHHLF